MTTTPPKAKKFKPGALPEKPLSPPPPPPQATPEELIKALRERPMSLGPSKCDTEQYPLGSLERPRSGENITTRYIKCTICGTNADGHKFSCGWACQACATKWYWDLPLAGHDALADEVVAVVPGESLPKITKLIPAIDNLSGDVADVVLLGVGKKRHEYEIEFVRFSIKYNGLILAKQKPPKKGEELPKMPTVPRWRACMTIPGKRGHVYFRELSPGDAARACIRYIEGLLENGKLERL